VRRRLQQILKLDPTFVSDIEESNYFLGKIGFLKPCAQTCPKNDKEIRCPRNPIFWEKSDFSNRVPKRAQKMTKKSVPKKSDFFEKSDFSNRAQTCPRNHIFLKNRISQTVCPNVPKK
jgi:hypothetical protein